METDIAKRLRAGDPASLLALAAHWGDQVYTFFLRRGLTPEQAAPAARASFVACWRDRLNAPRRDDLLPGWVFGHAISQLSENLAADPLADLPPLAGHALALVQWQGVDAAAAARALGVKPDQVNRLLADESLNPRTPVPADLQPLPNAVHDQLFLDASDDEVAVATQRGRGRGLALIAVILVAALVGGLALNRYVRHSQSQMSTEPSTSQSYADPSQEPSVVERRIDPASLEKQCRAKISHSVGPALFNAAQTVVLVHDAAKRVAVCAWFDNQLSVTADTASDSTVIRSTLHGSGGRSLRLYAGLLPKGYSRAGINTTEATTNGQYWLVTSDPDAQDEVWLTSQVVTLVSDSDQVWRQIVLPDDGTQEALPNSGAALKAACSGVSVPGRKLVGSFLSPQQAALALQYSGNLTQLCTSAGGASYLFSLDGFKNNGLSAFVDGRTSAQVVLQAGHVPSGVTAVHVTSPTKGDVAATIKSGIWLWDDVVDNTLLGIYPRTLTVRMTGQKSSTMVVPLGITSVGSYVPQLRFGADLRKACATKALAAPAVTSEAGHVVVFPGSPATLCWAQQPGISAGSDKAEDLVALNDLPPADDQNAMNLAGLLALNTPVGKQFFAGGHVPKGVVRVTYRVDNRIWPATIGNGYFADEFQLSNSDQATGVDVLFTYADGHVGSFHRDF